jgi:DNA-binding IclR family transcriptional regulator
MAVSTAKRKRTKPDPYAAPALEKGLDVLELLADQPAGMTLQQIADGLGRSHTELFRMVICLQRRGYVRRVVPGDVYELSGKLFDLSHRHPPTRSLLDAALPMLRELASQTLQSTHLAVRFDAQTLIAAAVESPTPRALVVRVGSRFPLEDTASGRVLLAWMTTAQVEAILGRRPGSELIARFDRIRRTGVEQRRSTSVRGVIDLSAPVRDARGEVVATVTIPFLSRRDATARDVRAATDLLVASAASLSRALGNTP